MANLITLTEYKDYAGISSSDQDVKLKNVILYTSDFIKAYCGRNFIDNHDGTVFTNITEYWSGGADHLYTREFPLSEIVSIEVSSDYGTTYTALVAGTDFVYDLEKERIYVPSANSYEAVNAYKVIYKGGFAVTPPSLKVAALDLVEYYMKKESTPRKTSGSISIEYIRSSDLPYHIKRVLDLYRVID